MIVMDAASLREVCLESCRDFYEYLDSTQWFDDEDERKRIAGVARTEVTHFKMKDGCILLYLSGHLNSTDKLGVEIDNEMFYQNDVTFDQLDEHTQSVVIYPSDRVWNLFYRANGAKINVFSDMKWLVKLTEDCFASYGDRLALPPTDPYFEPTDYPFLPAQRATEEQQMAV